MRPGTALVLSSLLSCGHPPQLQCPSRPLSSVCQNEPCLCSSDCDCPIDYICVARQCVSGTPPVDPDEFPTPEGDVVHSENSPSDCECSGSAGCQTRECGSQTPMLRAVIRPASPDGLPGEGDDQQGALSQQESRVPRSHGGSSNSTAEPPSTSLFCETMESPSNRGALDQLTSMNRSQDMMANEIAQVDCEGPSECAGDAICVLGTCIPLVGRTGVTEEEPTSLVLCGAAPAPASEDTNCRNDRYYRELTKDQVTSYVVASMNALASRWIVDSDFETKSIELALCTQCRETFFADIVDRGAPSERRILYFHPNAVRRVLTCDPSYGLVFWLAHEVGHLEEPDRFIQVNRDGDSARSVAGISGFSAQRSAENSADGRAVRAIFGMGASLGESLLAFRSIGKYELVGFPDAEYQRARFATAWDAFNHCLHTEFGAAYFPFACREARVEYLYRRHRRARELNSHANRHSPDR